VWPQGVKPLKGVGVATKLPEFNIGLGEETAMSHRNRRSQVVIYSNRPASAGSALSHNTGPTKSVYKPARTPIWRADDRGNRISDTCL